MADSRVLVVGATGQLGSVIVGKLTAAGIPVRALARTRDKLQRLAGPSHTDTMPGSMPGFGSRKKGAGDFLRNA